MTRWPPSASAHAAQVRILASIAGGTGASSVRAASRTSGRTARGGRTARTTRAVRAAARRGRAPPSRARAPARAAPPPPRPPDLDHVRRPALEPSERGEVPRALSLRARHEAREGHVPWSLGGDEAERGVDLVRCREQRGFGHHDPEGLAGSGGAVRGVAGWLGGGGHGGRDCSRRVRKRVAPRGAGGRRGSVRVVRRAASMRRSCPACSRCSLQRSCARPYPSSRRGSAGSRSWT